RLVSLHSTLTPRRTHPLPLPSFPTRRSSDLVDGKTLVGGLGITQSRPTLRAPRTRPKRASRRSHCSETPSAAAASSMPISSLFQIGRAHAELQSPYDLVCRLLLEKKKNKNTQ